MAAQTETDELRVWVDQDLCTGDGLCVQYAPEVFEFDVDGLAYVKDPAGELLLAPGDVIFVVADPGWITGQILSVDGGHA